MNPSMMFGLSEMLNFSVKVLWGFKVSLPLPLQILELPSHPFYVGVQFHPEFKSRPGRPSALFLGMYS